MNSEDPQRAILAFWNQRAGLGQQAGSRDVTLKQLEMQALATHVRDGMRVLEVGCGNGITACKLAEQYDVRITALDFAPEMIAAAQKLTAGRQLKGSVEFRVGDVRELPAIASGSGFEQFDLIYTERMVINLPDWTTQQQAITNIVALLAPGGAYAMCESSQDGLATLNHLRACVALPEIKPPWHNRYLRDAEIAGIQIPGVHLEKVVNYSGTYYFLSRVVNAWLAANEGREPAYDAPVNRLALSLPSFGQCDQSRLWLWRKTQ